MILSFPQKLFEGVGEVAEFILEATGRTPLRLFYSSLVVEPKFFFGWKALGKMKNDTTFVRMRSGDHLGDAKMSKKGTSLHRI